MKTTQALEPFEIEMIQEHIDLNEKIGKLVIHLLESPSTSEAEKVRIKSQIMSMQNYEFHLNSRLNAIFKEKNLI